MLPLAAVRPVQATLNQLSRMQRAVDDSGDYPARVKKAGSAWNGKTSTPAKAAAITDVRATLAASCVGPVRCHYCEDSEANEIEHVRPKSLFPQSVFVWENFLYACGACNRPKSNRYGYLDGGTVRDFERRSGQPVVPPPDLPDALIDPRREDPTELLELDLGGVTPDGLVLGTATFEFGPAFGLDDAAVARVAHTIRLLDLNRTAVVLARANAFGGFRAKLREYVQIRKDGAPDDTLRVLREGILETPHLTVFFEMRRQQAHLPFMQELVADAPEIMDWSLVPA